jgi:hypothetical protein
MTYEERRDIALKAAVAKTHQQLRERALKAWRTRHRKMGIKQAAKPAAPSPNDVRTRITIEHESGTAKTFWVSKQIAFEIEQRLIRATERQMEGAA